MNNELKETCILKAKKSAVILKNFFLLIYLLVTLPLNFRAEI